MHKRFDHKEIEQKWQEKWKKDGIYNVGERDESKEKEYVLVEWPYPSGNLHIGHWHAFAVPDIYVRYRRMKGVQVLYPMGFDAFGLPAENAAIKRKLDPRKWTESNMEYMRSQLDSMGNAFSWDMTTASTDPEYYKWTQWMFTKFFENDIAYRGEGVVNWCPGCHTVIANEQVQSDNTCERCDSIIERKKMPQWMIRITDFADELIDDLVSLNWPEHIKEAQRKWIGRSEGAEIDFELSVGEKVTVFTTRPDTLFGATYLVLAPEHALVQKYKNNILNWSEVEAYLKTTQQKAEQDRLDATKEKTGVKLEGVTATNPGSEETIPVYIADYVLSTYGTGAIMAVPAHDERDFAFAKKFNIEIKQAIGVIINKFDHVEVHRRGVYGIVTNEKGEYLLQHFKNKNFYWLPGGGIEGNETEEDCLRREIAEESGFTSFASIEKVVTVFYDHNSRKDGRSARNQTSIYKLTVNSSEQEAVSLTEAEISDGLELIWVRPDELEKVLENGESTRSELVKYVINYNSESAVVNEGALVNSGEFIGMNSNEAKIAIVEKVGGRLTNTYRLRDWSIGRQRYWGTPIPIVYDPEGKAHSVPLEHLPWRLPEDVDFTPTGVAPLAKSVELKKRTEEIFGAGWTPEVETMDTFVDSSWYYLRYIDNHNDHEFSSKKAQQTWLPIDIYFGGAEHNTMHLLYSRFWLKALRRLGLAEHAEPYTRRINRGLILGPDGNKMSKSKGNVVNPDEHVAQVGADTVKMYLAFMGPYGEMANYPWDMGGIAGLRRFLERVNGLTEHIIETEPSEMVQLLHKTIKKVSEDIIVFKFNTAISAMMIFVNDAEKKGLSRASYETFLRLLAPFAPHLTEELWTTAGNLSSIHSTEFPAYDPALTKTTTVTIGVQINGKVRGQITIAPNATEDEALQAANENAQLQSKFTVSTLKKVIYVPGRILNLVVND
jgi:leucyl-tRNA synthetase